MSQSSGVGVIDKATMILDALESGPASLAELVEATHLARPTAHRLAQALAHHGLVTKDLHGRFTLGPRLTELAAAAGQDRLVAASRPSLHRLRELTNESTQVFKRQGDLRICIASAERPTGLRDTIPVGTQLSMSAGSAAQVLLAWEDQARIVQGLEGARFTAHDLARVKQRGWAQSVGERERGVASVSAPIFSPSGKVLAALSMSGPVQRIGNDPGRRYGSIVAQVAHDLSAAIAT